MTSSTSAEVGENILLGISLNFSLLFITEGANFGNNSLYRFWLRIDNTPMDVFMISCPEYLRNCFGPDLTM